MINYHKVTACTIDFLKIKHIIADDTLVPPKSETFVTPISRPGGIGACIVEPTCEQRTQIEQCL